MGDTGRENILLPYNYIVLGFIYAVCGDGAADGGGRVDAGVAAEDCAGIEDAVAADLDIVAEDGADLFAAGFNKLCAVFYDDKALIAFDI